jgi:predicted transcriptional regulator
VAAIREGLADAEAGLVKPARKALKVLAKRYGIPTADE